MTSGPIDAIVFVLVNPSGVAQVWSARDSAEMCWHNAALNRRGTRNGGRTIDEAVSVLQREGWRVRRCRLVDAPLS